MLAFVETLGRQLQRDMHASKVKGSSFVFSTQPLELFVVV